MKKIIHYCWFGNKPLPKLAKKCIKSWKHFLPDYQIMMWSEKNVDLKECPFIQSAYENKKWAFVADYVRTKALNEFGGIYFDTDMKITKDISSLLEKQTFLGLEDTGYVAVGVWHEKEKGSYLTNELLKKYQSIQEFNVDKLGKMSIPILISEILTPLGLKKGLKEIQVLDHDITIYPRDYFYPYSFHRDNNIFTDHTCMIHYYDASWISARDRRDMMLVRIFGKKNANRILFWGSKLKWYTLRILRIPLFPIVLYRHHKKKMQIITEEYLQRITKTIELIQQNQNKEYLTFYNGEWFGVSSATKELFDHLVDCGEIYRKKDMKLIARAIINVNVPQVIFSSFAIGWNDLVKYLKKRKPSIKIKTFWHGSHSQVLDMYGWKRNLEIIDLHKKQKIDIMGTCKASLMNFYQKQGYRAFFITNKVSDVSKKIKQSTDKKKEKIIIGIYAAKCTDWRKNMYSQMAAVKLINNAVIDMVPLNEEAIEFAKQYHIEIQGSKTNIPREKLMERMAQNDVNLYVTFSECAPMLPLESMELGVPCITGNNHHYFQKTELEKYIVIDNECDIEQMKEKILLCIQNKEKIIELYQKFSEKNFRDSQKQVEEFLNL